ncbi:MAG: hypothetical protein HFJ51_06965 [Clostridia bacterium]|nr:hypothetical protein [Clostridia bacterium]
MNNKKYYFLSDGRGDG